MSIFSFKNLSIKYKVMIFFIVPYSVFFVGVLYFYFYNFKSSFDEKNNSEIISKINIFNNLVKDHQTKALQMATLVSNYSFIEKAYKMEDEEKGSQLLMSEIKPILKKISNDLNDFQLHFHKPKAKSFLRTWTNKRGDDLSKFRATILEVYETNKPLIGIELGVGGFAIRGIAPIFASNGNYLGSVEFFYTPENIIKFLDDSKNTIKSISAVNKQLASSLFAEDALKKSFAYSTSNFYYSKTEGIDDIKRIISDNDEEKIKSSNDIIVFSKDNFLIGVNPIMDYKGKNVGFISLIINNEANLKALYKSLMLYFGVMAGFSLFLLFVYNYAFNRFIIKPLNKAKEMAIRIAKGDMNF